MRKIFFLFIYWLPIYLFAQPYFTDTLSTYPNYTSPTMSNVFELPNNEGYAISTFKNYNLHIIYTDQYGQRTGHKDWDLFGDIISAHTICTSIKMRDGNYMIAGILQDTMTSNYLNTACLVVLDERLNDTLWTKKYQYIYQDSAVHTFFFGITKAVDNTIWVKGQVTIDGYPQILLMHTDNNGQILSFRHYPSPSGYYANTNIWLTATDDGGCIFSADERTVTGGEYTSQAVFVKVDANGNQEWKHSFGSTAYGAKDFPLFIAKATQSNEYWLFYKANTRINTERNVVKAVRVNGAGLLLDTITRIYPSTSLAFSRVGEINGMQQYPNGDIVFGMAWVDRPFNAGNNNSLDSIWRKPLPRPYHYTDTAGICKEATTPTNVLLADNGDIVCAGYYYDGFGGNLEIFLARVNHEGMIPPVSIAEPDTYGAKDRFKIFPNPAHDHITFDIPSLLPNESRLQLYDAQGRLVYEKLLPPDFGSFTVNTTDFSNGVYFYRYSVGGTSLQDGKISILK
jgi:hypothetical protein